jgi:hypothetical protein
MVKSYPNCQLLDFSTLFAANTVLQRTRAIYPTPFKYNYDYPVSRNFAWELRCLEIVIEAIILRNRLFMPAAVDIKSLPESTFGFGKKLIDAEILQARTKDEVAIENIIDELSYLLDKPTRAKNFLWDLSGHLMENVPKYSLHPEVESFQFNMTIYEDCLHADDIVHYNLAPLNEYNLDKPGKFETAFEYMIKVLFYDLIAKRMGVSYCPHPARVPFIEAWQMIEQNKIDVAKTVFDSISEFRDKAYSSVKLEPIRVPPLFAYVLVQATDTTDLVARAIRLRNAKPAKQFRIKCSDIEEKLRIGRGGLNLTSYLRDVSEMLDSLQKELGIESEKGQMGLSHVWVMQAPVRIPKFMFKSYYIGSEFHLNWLKDIAKLSVDIPSMESHLERLFKPDKAE